MHMVISGNIIEKGWLLDSMSNAGHAKRTTEDRRRFAFGSWPAHILLEAGETLSAQITEIVLWEGQRTNPLYWIHRWFTQHASSPAVEHE